MTCPAALPALALCAGVAAGVLGAVPQAHAILVLIAACAASTVAFFRRQDCETASAVAAGFLAVGSLLGSRANDAAMRAPLRTLFVERTAEIHQPDLFAWLEGRLRRDAGRGPDGTSLSLWVERLETDGLSRTTAGGVLISVNGAIGGDRVTAWRAGRRVRLPTTLRRPARYLDPGVPDNERALTWRGTPLVGSVKSPALVELVSRGGWPAELAASARHAARRAIESGVGRWSSRSAAVVLAILIGDRAGLDDEVERRLQEAGTYHVIAISGGNIAMLAGLLLGSLRLCRVPTRLASLLAIILLSGYAYFVGGGSSVYRATVMAIVYLSARLLDQRTAPMNAAAVAGAIILSSTPLAVTDPGFALTFGATVGIILGAKPVLDRIDSPRWSRGPMLLLAASLSAEAALLPVSAFVFSRVTFAGLLLNFAALPLMTVVQMAGIATVGCAALGGAAPSVPGYVAHLAVRGLVDSARLVDVLPWLVRRVPPPEPALVSVYYAGIVAWYFAMRRATAGTARASRWRVVRWLAGSATIVSLVCIVSGRTISGPRPAPGRLQVTFLDVGQGDAVFVRFPNGSTLLVDSGGAAQAGFDLGSRVVVPALWALGVRRLDYLAISHPHPDHLGGASAVLRDLRPRELWEGAPVPGNEPLAILRRDAGASGAGWRTLQAGDRIAFGAAELSVWHPPLPDWERQRVRDDDSLVLEVALGTVSVVLTGDVGAAIEGELARRPAPAATRILKVPHHGSATSSSPPFLDAMHPRAAIISVGRANPYGHPAETVLRRYRESGAAILRTDRDGAISLETDGRSAWIRTFAGGGPIRLP